MGEGSRLGGRLGYCGKKHQNGGKKAMITSRYISVSSFSYVTKGN